LRLLEDMESDVSATMLDLMGNGINQRLDTAVFVGDGTSNSSFGGITGLFADAGITDVTPAAATTLQAVTQDDFEAVIAAVDAAAMERQCNWWMYSGFLAPLLKVRDGSGKPLVSMPPDSDGFYLFGFRIVLTGAAPSSNAASQKVMAFGDGQGYMTALRNWFAFASSDHLLWDTGKRTFRALGRAFGKTRRTQAFARLKLHA
jgi:HK97 family phage major capsid protein